MAIIRPNRKFEEEQRPRRGPGKIKTPPRRSEEGIELEPLEPEETHSEDSAAGGETGLGRK
jgi:hypothetical protein